jgi:hypothetical protein
MATDGVPKKPPRVYLYECAFVISCDEFIVMPVSIIGYHCLRPWLRVRLLTKCVITIEGAVVQRAKMWWNWGSTVGFQNILANLLSRRKILEIDLLHVSYLVYSATLVCCKPQNIRIVVILLFSHF